MSNSISVMYCLVEAEYFFTFYSKEGSSKEGPETSKLLSIIALKILKFSTIGSSDLITIKIPELASLSMIFNTLQDGSPVDFFKNLVNV